MPFEVEAFLRRYGTPAGYRASVAHERCYGPRAPLARTTGSVLAYAGHRTAIRIARR